MKIAKWNEKATAMLDKLCAENNVKYANCENGVVFCDPLGTWLVFSPGSVVVSANHGKDMVSGLAKAWENAINSDGKLVESSVSGWMNDRKCRKFTVDDMEVYAQERFLRIFPKNTMFYVQSPYKPIVAGLWENDKLTVIGLVLPIRKRNGDEFTAA